MTRIIIHGCNGAMGRVLAQVAADGSDIEIVAGVDKLADPKDFPFPVFHSLFDCDVEADVMIDFSRPEALQGLLTYGKMHNIGLVLATTGYTDADKGMIHAAQKDCPIFQAANMSLGINLMINLIQKAASFFGDDFDCEIVEAHHNKKVDAPSGTALALADALNATYPQPKTYRLGRNKESGRRTRGEIGIHAIRGGTVVGEHSVGFYGTDEVVKIEHSALSKRIFAKGALRAAQFLCGQPNGFYCMEDLMAQETMTSLYTDEQSAMITVCKLPHQPKLIAQLFRAVADAHVNVDLISQSAPVDGTFDLSFTCPRESMDAALNAIATLGDSSGKPGDVHVATDIAIITVEGAGMAHRSGVAANIFQVLSDGDIPIRGITTSETKISCVIDQADLTRAVTAVVEAFEL